jgi:primosomal protein N' (replication factor Y) (superfamily II helicase)
VGDGLTAGPDAYAEVALQARSARVGRLLTYAVPEGWTVRPGQAVWVPLQRRTEVGVVARTVRVGPAFRTRALLAVLGDTALLSPRQLMLAGWLAERYACSLAEALSGFLPVGARVAPRLFVAPGAEARLEAEPDGLTVREAFGRRRYLELAEAAEVSSPEVVARLLRAGLLRTETAEAIETPDRRGSVPLPPLTSALSLAQRRAYEAIRGAIDSKLPTSFLLHGITGSGKTHVYLHAARHAVEQSRQVLALVSDISLVPAAERRFAAWFPGLVAVVHSERTALEQRDAWARIARGEARVVVGARSALFAPLDDLGLVVVDEEHEGAYKQHDTPPCYHARELALKLGELAGATVVLGSATPDITTYLRARRGEHQLLVLPRRYSAIPAPARDAASVNASADATLAPSIRPSEARRGSPPRPVSLPPVQVVDLRAELAAGNTGMFSRALLAGLSRTLDVGNQAILFLNRRGTATCVICRDCGHTVLCEDCSLPMIYHGDLDRLICHHCNRRRASPQRCPGCGGRRIRYLGAGTQRVADEVRRHFPNARLLRWDRDTAAKRGAHARLWDEFARGAADVLVGTQMVAKGLDFPRVTLVGVVLADASLNLPDYRASERAFQLLTQVAGRAGRGDAPGQVIVQTYAPQHYAVQAARLHDYRAFADRELAFRRQHAYPPFRRLARLIYSEADEARCWREAGRVLRELRARAANDGQDVQLIGPAPSYLRRLRGRYRWQIIVAAAAPERLLREHGLPSGWTVDVDPDSLL